MISGHQIVCLAPSEWADNPVSNMHVMSRLARQNEVLYVETNGARMPNVHDIPRIVRRLRNWSRGPRTQASHLSGAPLTVYSPLAPPYNVISWRNAPSRWWLELLLKRQLQRMRFDAPIVWTFTPRYLPIIDSLRPKLVVYHVVDELATYARGHVERFTALERRMLERADVVFVSGRGLFERKRQHNPHSTFHMPNGTDVEHFARSRDRETQVAPEIANLRGPRIGYVGTLASWTDFDLLSKVASTHPEWNMVMVGYLHPTSDIEAARKFLSLPNVHLMGQQPFSRLPEFYRGFDVCIIPHIVNEHVIWSNPVKIYEYLATGHPIVSTDFPAARDFAHLIGIGHDHDEFVACVEAAVSGHDSAGSQQRHLESLKHTWDARVDDMSQILGQRLRSLGSTVELQATG